MTDRKDTTTSQRGGGDIRETCRDLRSQGGEAAGDDPSDVTF